MKTSELNLAARPFSNQAPVLRVTVLLGLLAVALLVLNVTSYRAYFSGAGQDARQQLAEMDSQIRSADQELLSLRAELDAYDLAALNEQVEFLNVKIAERTFGWSRLFEDLGEVLPEDVRLQRLTPRLRGTGTVQLTLQGFARNDEGLLQLIDAMFAHDQFQQPSPSREATRDGQQQFSLAVVYLPRVAAELPSAEEAQEDDG